MVVIAIRALDYRMGNGESVMLVKALGRANELLTGAFFAHQPWSAQQVLDRRSRLDKFRLVTNYFFLSGNTASGSRKSP